MMFQVKTIELNPNASNVTANSFLDSQTKRMFVSQSVCMALTALVALSTNTIVTLALIQSLAKDARRGFRTMGSNSCITKLLLTSTTVCGAIYSVFIMPLTIMDIVAQGKSNFSVSFCYVRVYVDYMLCFVTNLHIVFLATDTYLLIYKPLVYRQLTAKVGFFTVAMGWILPSVLTLLWRVLQKEYIYECSTTGKEQNFLNNADVSTYFSFIFGIIFLLSLLYVWVVYFIIFFLIYQFHNSLLKKPNASFSLSANTSMKEPQISENTLRKEPQISENTSMKEPQISENTSMKEPQISENTSMKEPQISENTSMKEPQISENTSRKKPHNSEASLPESEAKTTRTDVITKTSKSKFKTNMKSFRFIGLVLLSYTSCWLPIWIVYLIYDTTGISIDFWVYNLLGWWIHFSYATNPLVYCLHRGRNRDVKNFLCGSNGQ